MFLEKYIISSLAIHTCTLPHLGINLCPDFREKEESSPIEEGLARHYRNIYEKKRYIQQSIYL